MTKIQKYGKNSYNIGIPPYLIKILGLEKGQEMAWTINAKGRLELIS